MSVAYGKAAKGHHEELQGPGRISFKKGGNCRRPNNNADPRDGTSALRNCDFGIG